ncbi:MULTISPECIES: NUDIX hydrolase [unclassified Nocardioides]|uniref:NUDIX hydrolase n=1 Tax=unclassified Nocardioides TaxID=2615069 RepID=UPI00360A7E13
MTHPTTTVTTIADGIARISWTGEEPIDVIRHNVVAALADHARVEALVDPHDEGAQRAATWSGLRREGVMRGVTVDGAPVDRIVYARLATDTPLNEPEGFRALLNSFLPRKRAIGQMLVRDHDGRVLLCNLTYKADWDLPGGVVEVNESPRLAVSREIQEELALDITPGELVLTDWLPAWSGWDDAVCLVFDGGTHDAAITDRIVREAREIRTAEFCTVEQVHERCADFTARRIVAALANVDAGHGPAYTESGR